MEEERSNEIELRFKDLFAVLAHCWWIMAIVAVVAAVGLFVFMKATHNPEYTSRASIYVMRSTQDLEGSSGTTSTADVSIANYLAKDCPDLVKSHKVLERVIYESNSMMTYEDLLKRVEVENKENTHMVYLEVTADTAESATKLVSTLAHVTCDVINNDLYGGQTLFNVVDANVMPSKISNPISKMTVILVAMLCAMMIYVFYLIRFLMDDKINTPEDVEKYLGLSLLGQIPNKYDAVRKKKYTAYTNRPQGGQ